MKITEKKNTIVVVWGKKTDKGITWRKVKEHCQTKMQEMMHSEEKKKVDACKIAISLLQSRVKAFETRYENYRTTYNSIHETDSNIDTPFEQEDTSDEEVHT